MTQPNPKKDSEFGKVSTSGTSEMKEEFSEIISFFKTLVIFLAVAIVLRASVVEAFRIPSGSMKPTLQIGDHILVNKLSYGFRLPFRSKILWRYAEPSRGDVVVFTKPDNPSTITDEAGINIIKRIIGLPGDVVEVRGTQVFVNGNLLQETGYQVRWEEGGIRGGDFRPQRVPEGHVFLLGDNRDHSKDSRFWEDGHFLDIDRIKGRAFIIYWSWDSPARIATLIH